MKLNKSDVMSGHYEFTATVEIKVGTEQHQFLYNKWYTKERIEGLMEDFGYPGAVVVASHCLFGNGNEMSGVFEIRSVA